MLELPPEVEPVPGEITRFYVTSRSKPEEGPQIVDMAGNKGSGSCSCPDFEHHVRKRIEKGAKPLTSGSSCHHLQLVWRYLLARTSNGLLEIAGDDGNELAES